MMTNAAFLVSVTNYYNINKHVLDPCSCSQATPANCRLKRYRFPSRQTSAQYTLAWKSAEVAQAQGTWMAAMTDKAWESELSHLHQQPFHHSLLSPNGLGNPVLWLQGCTHLLHQILVKGAVAVSICVSWKLVSDEGCSKAESSGKPQAPQKPSNTP
jgi:hypothetical protein